MDPAQDGYYNVKGLSNGAFLPEQALLEANGTNLVAGNTYYYRIKGVNSQGTGGRTQQPVLYQKMHWIHQQVRLYLIPMVLLHLGLLVQVQVVVVQL